MINNKELFAGGKALDEKSLEMLTTVIEQNNLPGFDYYEFKRAVAMLIMMDLDEARAHKSAYQTASTVGVTKEKLIETAKYYRNLMEKEQATFATTFEKQTQLRITDKQNHVLRLKDQVARHEADVARMQEEIAAYKDKVAQAELQITSDTDKLAGTRTAFEATLKAVILGIDTDIEKIHQHLS
jgi:hypothetical protein